MGKATEAGWMATKAGLVGAWAIVRRIEDRRGPDGRFAGTGVFSPDGDGLIWRESGVLTIGAAAPFRAAQRHLWRFAAGGGVTVLFADGRAFHGFDPDAPEAEHDCPPDLYRVAYAFDPPDRWRATWRVTGPRKNYRMVSDMTRIRA